MAGTTSWTRLWGAIGALDGAAAVAAGAFGAHAVADAGAVALLETGARWQVVSGIVAIVAARAGAPVAAGLHAIGALVFAASLYLLAAGAPSILGAVTPLGGVAMIAGWLALALHLLRGPAERLPSGSERG